MPALDVKVLEGQAWVCPTTGPRPAPNVAGMEDPFMRETCSHLSMAQSLAAGLISTTGPREMKRLGPGALPITYQVIVVSKRLGNNPRLGSF